MEEQYRNIWEGFGYHGEQIPATLNMCKCFHGQNKPTLLWWDSKQYFQSKGMLFSLTHGGRGSLGHCFWLSLQPTSAHVLLLCSRFLWWLGYQSKNLGDKKGLCCGQIITVKFRVLLQMWRDGNRHSDCSNSMGCTTYKEKRRAPLCTFRSFSAHITLLFTNTN